MSLLSLLNPLNLVESVFILRGGDGGKGGGDLPDYRATPVNLTTGFGTGSYDPTTGNVGYTLNPLLSQFRDYFYSQANNFMPTEQQTQYANDVYNYGVGLFGQAANLDTNKMTQDYYNQQQSNLAPTRALEESRLGDTLFKSGRTGYGTGYQGGGYVNPEQFSLLKAREEANNQMLLASEDRARSIQQNDLANALRFTDAGTALRTQPLTSLNQVLGLGTGIENLGYNQLGTLGSFSQLQNSTDQAAYQAAVAQAQSEGGGLFGGIAGGILGGASNVFGQGLGNWASSSLFGNSALGKVAQTATSTLYPQTNLLGNSYGLGGVSYF